MRAAVCVGPGAVELRELPDPVPGEGEVVCRVLACGVGGAEADAAWAPRDVPAVLGDALSGEVCAVGAGVVDVAVGDRVVVHHHTPCGECRRCRRGHETLCERFLTTRLEPGGLSERVLVGAELAPELLPLDGLDAERATFVEPLACVLRAFDRVGLRAGDALLVVGCGIRGLLAVAAAHARAVEPVWVREPRAERLEHALRLGGERHGNELVDAVLVCAPSTEAITDGLAAVAPGGALCVAAKPRAAAALTLDAAALFAGEVELVASSSAGPADMRAALDLLTAGSIDPLPLVTQRVGLAETGDAFARHRSGEALRTLVLPSGT